MNSDPKPLPRISSKKYRGLGDLVHAFAHPVAVAIDALTGTKLKSCGACARRRRKFNAAVPFVHPPQL